MKCPFFFKLPCRIADKSYIEAGTTRNSTKINNNKDVSYCK